MSTATPRPFREIRALHTEATVTVYQAYRSEIAEPALAETRFVPPFSRDRMTWIKPSFLWMAYRSGWATKPGQEHVLAIEITRRGFEWALMNSCLSRFEPGTYDSKEAWLKRKDESPVRIQWDPERDLELHRLSYRSIQIGLSGAAVNHYVDEWTVGIKEVTNQMRDINALIQSGRSEDACGLLPHETPYVLPPQLRARVGATP